MKVVVPVKGSWKMKMKVEKRGNAAKARTVEEKARAREADRGWRTGTHMTLFVLFQTGLRLLLLMASYCSTYLCPPYGIVFLARASSVAPGELLSTDELDAA